MDKDILTLVILLVSILGVWFVDTRLEKKMKLWVKILIIVAINLFLFSIIN